MKLGSNPLNLIDGIEKLSGGNARVWHIGMILVG